MCSSLAVSFKTLVFEVRIHLLNVFLSGRQLSRNLYPSTWSKGGIRGRLSFIFAREKYHANSSQGYEIPSSSINLTAPFLCSLSLDKEKDRAKIQVLVSTTHYSPQTTLRIVNSRVFTCVL